MIKKLISHLTKKKRVYYGTGGTVSCDTNGSPKKIKDITMLTVRDSSQFDKKDFESIYQQIIRGATKPNENNIVIYTGTDTIVDMAQYFESKENNTLNFVFVGTMLSEEQEAAKKAVELIEKNGIPKGTHLLLSTSNYNRFILMGTYTKKIATKYEDLYKFISGERAFIKVLITEGLPCFKVDSKNSVKEVDLVKKKVIENIQGKVISYENDEYRLSRSLIIE